MIIIACKGKLIAVLQELGYSKKRVQELIKLLEHKDKQLSDYEAEEIYNKKQLLKIKRKEEKHASKGRIHIKSSTKKRVNS